MSELVANCPRCGAKNMTFDLVNQIPIQTLYGWRQRLEVFCICRECLRSTVFIVGQIRSDDAGSIEAGLNSENHDYMRQFSTAAAENQKHHN